MSSVLNYEYVVWTMAVRTGLFDLQKSVKPSIQRPSPALSAVPKGVPLGTCYTSDMSRAVLYARVSTLDKNQDPETQLRQLREYATRRGFEVSHELTDRATGRNGDRPSAVSKYTKGRSNGGSSSSDHVC